jgi:hypothetical protein
MVIYNEEVQIYSLPISNRILPDWGYATVLLNRKVRANDAASFSVHFSEIFDP